MTGIGSLSNALGVGDARVVTFVGAGGKTTAILRVASELQDLGLAVVVTTTTLMGGRAASHATAEVLTEDPESTVAQWTKRSGVTFLHAGTQRDGKYRGVSCRLIDQLIAAGAADCILVEGDGARGLPIKMPDAHEPVIPPASDIVVPVVGLDALGRPIAPESVHRPELFPRRCDRATVTTETIAELLTSRTGGLKRVPENAVARPLLNKASLAGWDRAKGVALAVLEAADDRDAPIDRVITAEIHGGAFRLHRRALAERS